MSVEVKTPTKTAFGHREVFPCERQSQGIQPSPGTLFTTTEDTDGKCSAFPLRRTTFSSGRADNTRGRKRRFSERCLSVNESTVASAKTGLQHSKKKFGRGGMKLQPGDKKNVLPSKFLLGGNISDPLNLNSLCDEEVNRILNESTPHSSPVPLPAHKKEQVELLIPPNIKDPLNLNRSAKEEAGLTSPKSGLKKKKNKHKKKKSIVDQPTNSSIASACEDEPADKEDEKTSPEKVVSTEFARPMHIDITSDFTEPSSSVLSAEPLPKPAKPIDKIVSPVIPQRSPPRTRKRRRTCSEGTKVGNSVQKPIVREDVQRSAKQPGKSNDVKPVFKRQFSVPKPVRPKTRRPNFVHGNYNRYYGYRNPAMEDDRRLNAFHKDWFEGKDILDIGCNIGHVTLTIGRDHCPRRIVGMDIDRGLIDIAKRNIRHYLSSQIANMEKYASSLAMTYGPISAPSIPSRDEIPSFPNNVMFMQANYVLEKDELLDLQREEYDVILALSITKWIHLNFADSGMKRFFKRIFKQLRPGGKLILEPQGWASYKKRKKLNDEIFKNFQTIKMRPEHFTEYLLSKEVGFSTCETLDIPFNKSKGFQRPIQVFTKSDTATATPYGSRGLTPRMHGADSNHSLTPGYSCTSSCGATPRFEIGSPYAGGSLAWNGQKKHKYSGTLLSGAATPHSECSPATTPRVERQDAELSSATTSREERLDPETSPATTPREERQDAELSPATTPREERLDPETSPATTPREERLDPETSPATTPMEERLGPETSPATTPREERLDTETSPATTS